MSVVIICKSCSVPKPAEAFHVHRAGTRHPNCKECRNRYLRQRHSANPQRNQAQARAIREKRAAQLNELKNRACADCGHRFHPCAMDFDHRESEIKIGNVSHMLAKGLAMEVVLAEAAKCDVVCACCHRIRTFNRGRERGDEYSGWGRGRKGQGSP